jgi:hypothetical protein
MIVAGIIFAVLAVILGFFPARSHTRSWLYARGWRWDSSTEAGGSTGKAGEKEGIDSRDGW